MIFKKIIILVLFFYTQALLCSNISEGEAIHYTWIGPPTIANPLHSIIGHDYVGPIETALKLKQQEEITHIKHPITFYCLDIFKDYYVELFDKNNVEIKVVGIAEFLIQLTKSENKSLKMASKNFIKNIMKNKSYKRKQVSNITLSNKEVKKNYENRLSDVTLKDGFTLFLFAFTEGYIFDTNIIPTGEKIKLESHKNYLIPHIPEKWKVKVRRYDDLLENLDCFALYAPVGSKRVARGVFNDYIENNKFASSLLTNRFNCSKTSKNEYKFLFLEEMGLHKASFESHREQGERVNKNYNIVSKLENQPKDFFSSLKIDAIDDAKDTYWEEHAHCCSKNKVPCSNKFRVLVDKNYKNLYSHEWKNYILRNFNEYNYNFSEDTSTYGSSYASDLIIDRHGTWGSDLIKIIKESLSKTSQNFDSSNDDE